MLDPLGQGSVESGIMVVQPSADVLCVESKARTCRLGEDTAQTSRSSVRFKFAVLIARASRSIKKTSREILSCQGGEMGARHRASAVRASESGVVLTGSGQPE